MKMVQETQNVVRSGIKRSTECGMVINAKAFEMLARQYSDPIKAILQEIGANAADSHIRADKADVPFKVKLPNSLDSHLRIRDFGIGMPKDIIYNVYINYMKSDKTDTNEETGFFGIGSKTPLAYADSFNITTYNDGVMSMYSLGYNEKGIPELNEFGDYPTDDENGVEVSFAVKPDDFNKFADTAETVYSFFDTTPDITGNVRCSIQAVNKILEGTNWYMRKVGWNDSSMVVMGNIAYPIDGSHFDSGDYGCRYGEMLNNGFVVKVDMASINITPSREALEYTDLTIKTIKDALDAAHPEIETHVKQKLDACESMWSAMLESKKLKNYLGYRMSSSLKSLTEWRGKTFDFYGSQRLNVIKRYHLDTGRVRAKHTESSSVPVETTTKVVIKDIDSKFDSRCRYYCEESSHDVYLVNETCYEYGTTVVPYREVPLDSVMEKIGCIDSDEVVMLASDLPDPPKIVRTRRNGRRKKTVTLNLYNGKKDASYKTCWDEVEVEMPEGENLYVSISNYKTFDTEGSVSVSRISRFLSSLGITLPAVYGVKKAQLTRLEKSNNWTSLRYWVIEQIKDMMSDPIFVEKLENASAVDSITNAEEYKVIFNRGGENILDKEGSFYKLIKYCAQHEDNSKQIINFTRLCDHVGYTEKKIDKKDLSGIIEDVKNEYRLVVDYITRHGSWYFSSNCTSRADRLDEVVKVVNALDSFKEN